MLFFTLWGFAFALACRILSMPAVHPAVRSGLAAATFGILSGEIGGQFYEEADKVFHKGIGHAQPRNDADWFARMRRQVAPQGHFHLHGEGVLEIMPWLYFATRADPNNVTAYTVSAYWLAGEGGRPDLAEQVLNEALRNNPSDYRIYMEKGRLALRNGRYRQAARAFDAALVFLPGTTMADKEQLSVDLAEMLTYRGLLFEMNGELQKALLCHRETLRLFPARLHLKERMLALEQTGRSTPAPEELLKVLLLQRRHVCAEEE